jgi:hypothetical protein
VGEAGKTGGAAPRIGHKRVRWTKAMKESFFNHLTTTGNVKASAQAIGIDPRSAYTLRRKDQQFAADWGVAIAQGYEILETHLLAMALSGESAIDTGGVGPGTVIDFDMAMRLLGRQHAAKAPPQRRGGPRRKLLTNEEIDAALLAKLGKLIPPAEPA